MGVGIGKALGAIELRDGDLIDEEGDAEPALSHDQSSAFRMSVFVGWYQSEVEFRPPVCGAWFGEDGYCDGPSQEYHEALDAVEYNL